jgi:hypothetical protein
MTKSLTLLSAIALCALLAPPSQAQVLHTDFTGRTVSGNTASNITWVTMGLLDPGDLTAVDVNSTGFLAGLFNTAEAQGHFAPDLNTGNEGPWSTTIPLTVTAGNNVLVEGIALDWQHFNNSGNFQTTARAVDWTATLSGSSSGVIDSVTNLNVNGISGMTTLSFATPHFLDASETYSLNILAEGSNTDGNNTGLDAISVNGGLNVLLRTNFDGRTVSGNTASNLNWIRSGFDDPGDLTASHALFDTSDAQGRFAVARNLHTDGNWSVDIPLTVDAANNAELSTLNLDVFIYNNAGDLQTSQRDVDFTAELLDSAMTLLDSDTVLDIYANTGTADQPQGVSFDFSGNTLLAGESYLLRLTASGQGVGNNAGIDNFTLSGQLSPAAVPEPASIAIWSLVGLALAGFGFYRVRRRTK